MYTNPDGSVATQKPTDGDIFYSVDKVTGNLDVWTFSAQTNSWNCTIQPAVSSPNAYVPQFRWKSVSATGNQNMSFSGNLIGNGGLLINPPEVDVAEDFKNSIKCDCGAEACGHPGHSDWCNKFEYQS